MGHVLATITTSLDGYITGPDDGPGRGLGVGGERLHHWVMGGPWTYEHERTPGEGMSEADEEFMHSVTDGLGAGICGRGMYEAAGRWGGTNPFDGTLVVLTHRTEDAPDPSTGFVFVDGFDAALARAREAAGDRGVAISGGADTIRQALRAGVVDVLAISTAPVILGGGKRLFDGFEQDVDLEIERVHTSPLATHVTYRVVR
jgi:dihydrofolate reductase